MGGGIGCASFPDNCTATLSVLAPGTAVDEAWRPPEHDPRWLPDYRGGTTTDRFAPQPVGAVPVLTAGDHLLVVSLLGTSDVPSFHPDGSEATDLLARCSTLAGVEGDGDPMDVVVTFTPSETTFDATCSIEVGVR